MTACYWFTANCQRVIGPWSWRCGVGWSLFQLSQCWPMLTITTVPDKSVWPIDSAGYRQLANGKWFSNADVLVRICQKLEVQANIRDLQHTHDCAGGRAHSWGSLLGRPSLRVARRRVEITAASSGRGRPTVRRGRPRRAGGPLRVCGDMHYTIMCQPS